MIWQNGKKNKTNDNFNKRDEKAENEEKLFSLII